MKDIEHYNFGTVNKNSIVIGDLILYFSYETCVAFSDKQGLCVSENIWTRTTGKFLNDLQADKSKRLKHPLFTLELEKACSGIGGI